ncbi:hypothetical protein RDI58_014415 [Solanum bulbocastanum]|uniref:Uncharacterized protein n=1 Tax=Solanum bulbocastanum TaxID=147425 RepID=A0AAN8YAJ4_SOLBU
MNKRMRGQSMGCKIELVFSKNCQMTYMRKWILIIGCLTEWAMIWILQEVFYLEPWINLRWYLRQNQAEGCLHSWPRLCFFFWWYTISLDNMLWSYVMLFRLSKNATTTMSDLLKMHHFRRIRHTFLKSLSYRGFMCKVADILIFELLSHCKNVPTCVSVSRCLNTTDSFEDVDLYNTIIHIY